MLLIFEDNTWLEKPMGSKLVGIKRNGKRPVRLELDYYDLGKLVNNENKIKYLISLWTALSPDKRIIND